MQFIVTPVQQNSVSYPGLDPNKRYVIAASHSGHVISVKSDGVYLEQRKWSESATQQWRFEPISGTNYYKIISVASGKVVDIVGASTADLAGVCVWSYGGGYHQQFEVIYLGASKFRIHARHSTKALDVEGNATVEGARIIQHFWHGGINQQFRISEVLDISTGATFDSKVTLYEHSNYAGVSKQFGLGSYDVSELGIPNDSLSSMRVPPGMRVTLYEHPTFRGQTKVFTSDTTYVGDDFNDLTSAILIDLVATVYEHGSYQGRSQALGLGNYPMSALTFGNDAISSIKVPPGMQVILFENADFTGARKVVTTDIPFLSDFNERTSSIQVKMVGVVIPDDAIRYGGEIALRSVHDKLVTASSTGSVRCDATTIGAQAKFTVVRAGPVANGTYLSYGDVVALETSSSHYIGRSGTGVAATGDPTNGKPAVCSMGAGKIHMFARGPTGAAWWRTFDEHWSRWVNLSGGIIGAPAAVSWGPNRVDMVARGTDNAVWIRTWNGSTWTDWASINGNITSAPTICSWGSGRLDVFARGTDGSLVHACFANNAWSAWESLGGGIQGAPAAVSWGANRIDVFVRRLDNAVGQRYWNGAWQPWANQGGSISDDPAICSWASGRLDIFGRGSSGSVVHKWFASGWSGWEDLGGTIQGGPAACSWGPNRIDVFARGTNTNIWHRRSA